MFDSVVPYTLNPGQMYLAKGEGYIRTVVGSAVSVCIWDEHLSFACMCHFVFPRPVLGAPPSGLYATESIPAMLRALAQAGSKRRSLTAHILGGASPSSRPDPTALASVEVAKEILHQNRIPVISEDVGGSVGRKIVFNAENGNVAVVKVRKLRDGDFN